VREARVENYFVRRVKRAGGEVRKMAWIGRRHAPDRAVLWPKLMDHDLVELKAPGKKARDGQKREHERLRSAGFSCFVLDTKDKVDAYMEWRGFGNVD
jgi:hypothetical protein